MKFAEESASKVREKCEGMRGGARECEGVRGSARIFARSARGVRGKCSARGPESRENLPSERPGSSSGVT
jgi:hypothetical protein